MNAEITAAEFCVPGDIQTAEQLATLLKCEVDWLENKMGVATRYACRPGDDPAFFASIPARRAMEQRGAPDLIIYASATVRQFIPDTSVFVARELGLDGVPCFCVHATCLSFLIALNHASLVIDAGQCSRVLIVCAEMATLSRNIRHQESAALFGDGAAAVMVEPSQRKSGPVYYCQKTWPVHAELAQIRGGGLLRHPEFAETTPEDHLFQMDGDNLLRATLPRLKPFLDDFFRDASMTPESVDWLIPHQTSAAGMKVLPRLGIPEDRTIDIFARYGNCVSASLPMALAVAVQGNKIQSGDLVLFLGSAAGLSLGAMLWTW
ncbi:MAG: hypothetical protein KDA91_03355 [Planctomycetaceae bacterium]|nr:hypothetical protein [Planctomycetaceae bacterium]